MKAKVSDGGKYSCVAMNAAGEAHRHIHLTVLSRSTPTGASTEGLASG